MGREVMSVNWCKHPESSRSYGNPHPSGARFYCKSCNRTFVQAPAEELKALVDAYNNGDADNKVLRKVSKLVVRMEELGVFGE